MSATLVKVIAYTKRKESFINILNLLLYDTDMPQKNLPIYVDTHLCVCVWVYAHSKILIVY